MKGCVCCEGLGPEKYPDLTLEELEWEYAETVSDEFQDMRREWLETRPPAVRAVAEKFMAPFYRIKAGNPYKYTPAGCIVTLFKVVEHDCEDHVVAEPWFVVLCNPAGYTRLATPLDEEWLEPITTMEQLRDVVLKN